MRLKRSFFERDVLEVAPDLLGKYLVKRLVNGQITYRRILDIEAYGGMEDLASHARFGLTKRNEVMFERGGLVYVYFVYGMYWMLNIVTGKKGNPQAVLIRGLEGVKGPGRVGKWIGLDKSFYGEDLTKSKRIWIEEHQCKSHAESGQALPDKSPPSPKATEGHGKIIRTGRVGVSYSGKWARKKWRFMLNLDNARS